MANDREPRVTLVHRADRVLTHLVFQARVGNVEFVLELTGSHEALVRALEKGTPGALHAYLDYDVEIGEREVRLAQRSFSEGPGRTPLRRCIVHMQSTEWSFVLARMRADISGLLTKNEAGGARAPGGFYGAVPTT